MKKYLLIAIALLAACCMGLWSYTQRLRKENTRLDNNQTTLMQKAKYYETEVGKSAASVQSLKLDYSELKDNYARICQTADELGVKVKRLQAAATTATQTEVRIVTQVRDSIVYRNGTLDSVKMIDWRDAWVDVDGMLSGNDLSLNVLSRDTIIQVIHRVPKRFLFFRWGTKAIRQEIKSSNPHTKITYTEYIELGK